MDTVTLGAALSIMKKMPDTAAASAAAAEDAADRAEAAAEQAEGAIEVDDTLSVEGRAADSKVVGNKIATINSKFFGIDDDFINESISSGISWTHVIENCFYDGDTIEITNNGQETCIATFRDASGTGVFSFRITAGGTGSWVISGTPAYLNLYRENDTPYNVHIKLSGGIKVVSGLSNDAKDASVKISQIETYIKGIASSELSPVIEQGGLTDAGINTPVGHATHGTRVRVKDFVLGYDSITVSYESASNVLFSISFYTSADYSLPRTSNVGWQAEGATISIPSATPYMRILFKKNDGSAFTPSEISDLEITVGGLLNYEIKKKIEGTVIDDGSNYEVTPWMSRLYIAPEYIGLLTYLQAFCRYNGYWYSTNGTNISKQDSSFAEVSNVAISVGHGNSMQVGTMYPNRAYISGWNDQEVYIVDLDNITVVDTITLPTTGYTTVAIDDINGIAYIFQRETYPSTESYYTFIKYDYVNGNTISTRILSRKFAAIQGVEFYEGKIYVLNGLGTVVAPNYYLVYNTVGDVIGEFILGDFSSIEPEGVYIDREKRDIYMSFVNRRLYKIN